MSDENCQLTRQLHRLIEQMSEDEKRKLLTQLQQKAFTEKRRYPRRPFLMPLAYAAEGKSHRDSAQNISVGGMYITTEEDLAINQKITMIIPLFSFEDPVKITGKIVWRDANGIGVQFESDNPFIQQLIRNKIKDL